MKSFSIPLKLQLHKDLWNALVKLRADYVCEECGYEPPENLELKNRRREGLHAHHIDENHSNNCLMNGEALCQPCHSRKTALARHRKGEFGRNAWKGPQMSCEHCKKVVLVKNYSRHLRARHKAAFKEETDMKEEVK